MANVKNGSYGENRTIRGKGKKWKRGTAGSRESRGDREGDRENSRGLPKSDKWDKRIKGVDPVLWFRQNATACVPLVAVRRCFLHRTLRRHRRHPQCSYSRCTRTRPPVDIRGIDPVADILVIDIEYAPVDRSWRVVLADIDIECARMKWTGIFKINVHDKTAPMAHMPSKKDTPSGSTKSYFV